MEFDLGMTELDVDDEQAGNDGDSALGDDRYTYASKLLTKVARC